MLIEPLWIGILLVILAFASELHFHFVQKFMKENFKGQEQVFWRAEYAEVFNSLAFLILGIILIGIGLVPS